jgi:hypothetical protein
VAVLDVGQQSKAIDFQLENVIVGVERFRTAGKPYWPPLSKSKKSDVRGECLVACDTHDRITLEMDLEGTLSLTFRLPFEKAAQGNHTEFSVECERGDSNPHGVSHEILSLILIFLNPTEN